MAHAPRAKWRTPSDPCSSASGYLTVPLWYRLGVAMNLRLTDAETDALRRTAAAEGRSMQEVARAAIAEYIARRPERLRRAIEKVRTEDAELLDRLSR